MDSDLSNLNSEEALLLMYAADELSPGQRMQVERMLADDARLRDEAERVSEALNTVSETLYTIDRNNPLATPREVAVRRVARSVNAWQTARAGRAPAVAAAAPVNRRWLVTAGTGVAACIAAAALVWFVNMQSQKVEIAEETDPRPRVFMAGRTDAMFHPPLLDPSTDEIDSTQLMAADPLDRLEQEVVALNEDTDDTRGFADISGSVSLEFGGQNEVQ